MQHLRPDTPVEGGPSGLRNAPLSDPAGAGGGVTGLLALSPLVSLSSKCGS